MSRETLLHIIEDLNDEQCKELVECLTTMAGGEKPKHNSKNRHLLFVGVNDQTNHIVDLVNMAKLKGVTARVIDF